MAVRIGPFPGSTGEKVSVEKELWYLSQCHCHLKEEGIVSGKHRAAKHIA